MAWNDNPQVRDLAMWAKKHKYNMTIAIVFQHDLKGGVGYVSYGCDKSRCDWAKQIGDRIYGMMLDGDIDLTFEAGATATDASV